MNSNLVAIPRTPRKPPRLNHIVSATPGQRLKSDIVLNNYVLGERIGKGASATIYKAFNKVTGEMVAIKRVGLEGRSADEVQDLMNEIDLLKSLRHPNIVKYHGFIKDSETLNIILELCESGSLRSMCQSFGNFPEPLLAGYIVQVLRGLRYLHEQGTIHRDIKGANILTDKEGNIKLADFGVATQLVVGTVSRDMAVVGTPYWMAPEVIEVNGATATSDIWSLGCTIVELLTGKPPNYDLDQMTALYAIVSKDIPIPDGISENLKDFLSECFQKDPNLRVSASILQKHSWLRMHQVDTKYEDAIKTVKLYNSPEREGNGKISFPGDDLFSPGNGKVSKQIGGLLFKSPPPGIQNENIDRIGKGNSIKKSLAKSPKYYRDDDDNAFGDLVGDLNVDRLQAVINSRLSLQHPNVKVRKDFSEPMIRQSSLESQLSNISDDVKLEKEKIKVVHKDIHSYSEMNENDNDYTDDFQDLGSFNSIPLIRDVSTGSSKSMRGNMMSTPITTAVRKVSAMANSTTSATVSEDPLSASTNDSDNPFLKIDFDESNEIDLELKQVQSEMKLLVDKLDEKLFPGELKSVTNELVTVIKKYPSTKSTLIKSYGLSKMNYLLKEATSKTVVLNLIEVLILVSNDEPDGIEDFWLLGGMSVIVRLLSKRNSSHVRRQVALLLNQTCENNLLNLQIYMGCGGIQYLYEFLNEDYKKEKVLVSVGLIMMGMVLERGSSGIMKKGIYKSLNEENTIQSLVDTLTIECSIKSNNDVINNILRLLLMVSHEETISNVKVVAQLLNNFNKLSHDQHLSILKFIKNISQQQSNLEQLDELDTTKGIVDVLREKENTNNDCYKELLNQAIPIIFNLCRLNSNRQEKAASLGLIPLLMDIVSSQSIQERDNIKELSLQMLCDMTHAGKISRDSLWNHNCLELFLTYTSDPYWQRNIYDGLVAWLRGDIRVQQRLSLPIAVDSLLEGLKSNTNGVNYGDLINSFSSMIRISPLLCKAIPLRTFYTIIRIGLHSSDPLVIVNLLRALLTMIDVTGSSISDIKLRDQVLNLRKHDNSNLVRQLASEVLK